MALRGPELILFIRAQNQASSVLRRVAGDVRMLTHVQDLNQRMERQSIAQSGLERRSTEIRRQIAEYNAGGAKQIKQAKALNALNEKRLMYERGVAKAIRDQASINRTMNKVRRGQGNNLADIGRVNTKIADLPAKFARQRAGYETRIASELAKSTGYTKKLVNLEKQRRDIRQGFKDIDPDTARKLRRINRDQSLRPGERRTQIRALDPDTVRKFQDLRGQRLVNEKEIRATRKAFGALDDSVGHLRGNLAGLATKEAEALDTLQRRKSTLGRAIGDGNVKLADLRSRLDTASVAQATAGRKARGLARDYELLELKTKEAAAAQRTLHNDLRRVNREMALGKAAMAETAMAQRIQPIERRQQLGRTASHIGRAAQLPGLIGTAAIGGAASVAANFDTQVTLAATQARDIGGSFDQIGERANVMKAAIIDMMQEFPANQEEMSQATYEIFSSMDLMKNGVVDVTKGLQILRVANKVAVAGQTNLKDATNGLVTVLNNFDPQLQHVNGTLDTMFTIIRFGRMTLKDFNTMMIKIAPAAKNANQSLEDIGPAMAFLTKLIPSQRVVATTVKRLLDAFNHPDIVGGLKKVGVEIVDKNDKLLQFNDIMKLIVGRFPELRKGTVSGANFFKTISAIGRTHIEVFDAKGDLRDLKDIQKEVEKMKKPPRAAQGINFTSEGRTAFTTFTKNFGAFEKFIDEMGTAEARAGQFKLAFDAMMASPGVRWKVFINQFRAGILLIGQAAIPTFQAIGEQIGRLVGWFHDLSPTLRDTIVKFIAFSAIGAMIGGVFLSIGGSIVAMLAGLKLLGIGLEGGTLKAALLFKAIRGVGLISLGVLLTQLFGIEKAILGMAIAWAIFKRGGIGSAIAVAIAHKLSGTVSAAAHAQAAAQSAAVWRVTQGVAVNAATGIAAANVVAARVTTAAWRVALAATGWGLLLVAASVAIEYIMTHMDQMRAYWAGLTAFMSTAWSGLWARLKTEVVSGIADILRLAAFFARQLDKVLGSIPGYKKSGAGKALVGFNEFVQNFKSSSDKNIANLADPGAAAAKAYRGSLHDSAVRRSKDDGIAAITDFTDQFNAAGKEIKDPIAAKIWKQMDKELKDYQALLTAIGKAGNGGAAGIDEAARASEGLRDVMKGAVEEARRSMDQAAANLSQIYEGFKQENQQRFGALFSGDWLSGEFGDTAEKWGVQAGIGDLTKDLKMQLADFNKYNGAIAGLRSRGAPEGLINELKALGPDAMENIETLRRAAPAKYKAFIAVWNAKEKAINDATKIDFDAKLKQWYSYGKGIAQNIIFGLQSENVALDTAFRNLISAKFPNFTKDAVAKAVADYKANQPAVETAAKDTPAGKKDADEKKAPARLAPKRESKPVVIVHQNHTHKIYPLKGENAMDTARRHKHLWTNRARLNERSQTARSWGIPD